MDNPQKAWETILSKLENNIDQKSYSTFFQKTQFLKLSDNLFQIRVPIKVTADYLNKNYSEILEKICQELFEEPYRVKFTAPSTEAMNIQSEQSAPPNLNVKYTFENFVVGKSNNFAHSAAIAVSESPGTIYNPLFIYGESGMGKTHLMQAIGHYVFYEGIRKNVYYTTAEAFMNDMIECLRSNNMASFRNKFRSVNLLLIDDIHFLSKKEGTQEEFFHTFNALYENKNQIVMTSDRPPKDISDLEKRLVTRFEWGLLADLKTPNFETRVAILKKKAEMENINLHNSVVDYIAEHVHNNVRVLEGTLLRLGAYASYKKINPQDIDVRLAKEVLGDLVSDAAPEITLEKISQKVCTAFHLTPSNLLDDTRRANIAYPRQIAMYLATMLIPQLSLKEIAVYFQRKDHTTVLHARNKLDKQFKEDDLFRGQVEEIIKAVREG